MEQEINILKDFVEGVISPKIFEKHFFGNSNFEELLSDATINLQGTYMADSTIYGYILGQKIQTIRGRLNVQGAIQLFFNKKGIKFNQYKKYADEYGLILDSQPKYIDADLDFIEKYILPEDINKSKSELIKEIRDRFSNLFKYHTKPPKWIQNPNWIIKDERPLFFLGQFEIKNCDIFHDNGIIYLFVNQITGDIETIKQFY